MMTCKDIVKNLDAYIIGQAKAKRAVAIALRNRYRRSKLPKELSDEITPKNIILKGPTGVGKTEIARRLAKLVNAPFVKVAQVSRGIREAWQGRRGNIRHRHSILSDTPVLWRSGPS